MYVPPHTRQSDPDFLHELLDRYDFGLLVIAGDDGRPEAVHLPFLHDREPAPHGRLLGHLARANPIARGILAGRPALCIFQGPHGYISPAWYQDRDTVPTWNYVALHVNGVARPIDDRQAALDLLRRAIERYETPRPAPWRWDEVSPATLSRLLPAIVAFELPIASWQGKAKLSQNHPRSDRLAVVAALRREQGAASEELARWMERFLGAP